MGDRRSAAYAVLSWCFRVDRSRDRLIVAKRRRVLSQRRLSLHQLIELLLELLLDEKLPFHGAVELRAQVANMLFISRLHLGRWVCGLIAKREISAGCDRPHCRDN